MPSVICKQVNGNVKQTFAVGLKCRSFQNLVFNFCSRYVQSNLNQPGRVLKRRGPVIATSGSETECVASADNDREMVVIPRVLFRNGGKFEDFVTK